MRSPGWMCRLMSRSTYDIGAGVAKRDVPELDALADGRGRDQAVRRRDQQRLQLQIVIRLSRNRLLS